MAFTLGKHLVFIDGFQLMGSNLDKPVNNLQEEAYTYTQEVFQCDEQKLMVKKGVYSYD